MTGEEADIIEMDYMNDASIGSYMFFFSFDGEKYCVDATEETGKLGRLINHSRKNANVAPKVVGITNPDGESLPHLMLLAKRDINKGEELLYDYKDRRKASIKAFPFLNE